MSLDEGCEAFRRDEAFERGRCEGRCVDSVLGLRYFSCWKPRSGGLSATPGVEVLTLARLRLVVPG